MGWAFAFILQNMRCETITYTPQPAEISAGCVSSPQEARCLEASFEASLQASPPARFSESVSYMWGWISAYFAALISGLSYGANISKNSRAALILPTGNPDAPLAKVYINRHLLRKLRRRARLGERRASAHHFNLTAYQTEPVPRCPRRYRSYMLRVYRMGRTAMFGLNARLCDVLRMSLWRETQILPLALCNAPLSPD